MINVLRGHFQDIWRRSRFFRVVLVLSVGYTVLRTLLQIAILIFMLSAENGTGVEISGSAISSSGPLIPDDLRIYLDASERLKMKQDLYIQGTVDRMEFYQYAPSFALAMVPFLWVTREVAAIIHTVFHFFAYGFLFILWAKIFHSAGLLKAENYLIWTLPTWLLFSSFWTDLGYLNVYIFMALLATFSIKAIMEERLEMAVLWLTIILQIKPQWSFAMVVPLLLGRRRFFFKLLSLTFISYMTLSGVTVLAIGPRYGWGQYVDYISLLRGISAGGYPWRTPKMPFLGYNHSIKQVLVYILGSTPAVFTLVNVTKGILLAPLGILGIRYLLNPVDRPGVEVPRLALDLTFIFYLAAFIWLDMVWELSLGIATFTYLIASVNNRNRKNLVIAAFLPYALLDPFRILGLILSLLGVEAIAPGLYILTDPAIYIPLIMISILVFYALLIRRLWTMPFPDHAKTRHFSMKAAS